MVNTESRAKPNDKLIKKLQEYKKQIKEYKVLLFLTQNADILRIPSEIRQLLFNRINEIKTSALGWESEEKKQQFEEVVSKKYKLEDFLPDFLNPYKIGLRIIKKPREEQWYDDAKLADDFRIAQQSYEDASDIVHFMHPDFDSFFEVGFPRIARRKEQAVINAALRNGDKYKKAYEEHKEAEESKIKRTRYQSNLDNWLKMDSEGKLESLNNGFVSNDDILYRAIETLKYYEELYKTSNSVTKEKVERVTTIADTSFEVTAFGLELKFFEEMIKKFGSCQGVGKDRFVRSVNILEAKRSEIISRYIISQSTNPLFNGLKELDITKLLQKNAEEFMHGQIVTEMPSAPDEVEGH